MDKAYVKSLETGEIVEVLDTDGRTGYDAAREASERAGIPKRTRWHFGKPVTSALAEAGELITDWRDWDGKRYEYVSDRFVRGSSPSGHHQSETVGQTMTSSAASDVFPLQHGQAPDHLDDPNDATDQQPTRPDHEPRLTWTRDELILACDLVLENNWNGLDQNDPRVHALSALLQQLPIYPVEVRGPKFRNPNGVARKTYDIATHHPDYKGKPTKGGVTDLQVLREFLDREDEMRETARLIREGVLAGDLITTSETVPDIEDLGEDSAPEGRLLERRHFARERDRSLRAKKIKQHRDKHGSLACAICGFDFAAAYGDHGDGYIECHHVIPLHASGEVETRLDDLILICANCHRMVHRTNPWLTPEQLRALVKSQQPAG